MTTVKQKEHAIAVLLVRLVLGLIFVQAGIFKIFEMGPIGHAKRYFLVEPYLSSFLPSWSLWLSGLLIPFFELFGGAMVLIGFKTREALMALGAVLILVTFGHLLANPLFAFHEHVFPCLIMVVFLLMFKNEDLFSFDSLRRRR